MTVLAPPPADQAQLLVPHGHVHYPYGLVVRRDAHRGLLIRCACGAERWTTYGQSQRHATRCPVVARMAWADLGGRGTPEHAVTLALGRRSRTAEQVADALHLSTIRARVLLRRLEAQGLARRAGPPPHRWKATP